MLPWFAHPLALALLALVPVLGMAAALSLYQRRHVLARLGKFPALEVLISARRGRRVVRTLLLLGGLTLLIIGIAGPQWGRDRELASVPGKDIVVLVDMSRSMLAQDALGSSAPNRLGLAVDALRNLVEGVQEHGGHRLGLVVFAARARVVCPLTHDYDHFRDALAQFDPDDPAIGPPSGEDIPPSGTRMGAGLRLAAEIHDERPRFQGHQVILMLSDGDDPAGDEEWRTGAVEARQRHIPVHTVGFGDPEKGSRIPVGSGFLRYHGQEVLTQLQEKPLKDIARETGGLYIPAQARPVPLHELLREVLEARPGPEDDREELVPGYRQHYPWFLAAGLVLFTIEMMLGDGRRTKLEPREQTT